MLCRSQAHVECMRSFQREVGRPHKVVDLSEYAAKKKEALKRAEALREEKKRESEGKGPRTRKYSWGGLPAEGLPIDYTWTKPDEDPRTLQTESSQVSVFSSSAPRTPKQRRKPPLDTNLAEAVAGSIARLTRGNGDAGGGDSGGSTPSERSTGALRSSCQSLPDPAAISRSVARQFRDISGDPRSSPRSSASAGVVSRSPRAASDRRGRADNGGGQGAGGCRKDKEQVCSSSGNQPASGTDEGGEQTLSSPVFCLSPSSSMRGGVNDTPTLEGAGEDLLLPQGKPAAAHDDESAECGQEDGFDGCCSVRSGSQGDLPQSPSSLMRETKAFAAKKKPPAISVLKEFSAFGRSLDRRGDGSGMWGSVRGCVKSGSVNDLRRSVGNLREIAGSSSGGKAPLCTTEMMARASKSPQMKFVPSSIQVGGKVGGKENGAEERKKALGAAGSRLSSSVVFERNHFSGKGGPASSTRDGYGEKCAAVPKWPCVGPLPTKTGKSRPGLAGGSGLVGTSAYKSSPRSTAEAGEPKSNKAAAAGEEKRHDGGKGNDKGRGREGPEVGMGSDGYRGNCGESTDVPRVSDAMGSAGPPSSVLPTAKALEEDVEYRKDLDRTDEYRKELDRTDKYKRKDLDRTDDHAENDGAMELIGEEEATFGALGRAMEPRIGKEEGDKNGEEEVVLAEGRMLEAAAAAGNALADRAVEDRKLSSHQLLRKGEMEEDETKDASGLRRKSVDTRREEEKAAAEKKEREVVATTKPHENDTELAPAQILAVQATTRDPYAEGEEDTVRAPSYASQSQAAERLLGEVEAKKKSDAGQRRVSIDAGRETPRQYMIEIVSEGKDDGNEARNEGGGLAMESSVEQTGVQEKSIRFADELGTRGGGPYEGREVTEGRSHASRAEEEGSDVQCSRVAEEEEVGDGSTHPGRQACLIPGEEIEEERDDAVVMEEAGGSVEGETADRCETERQGRTSAQRGGRTSEEEHDGTELFAGSQREDRSAGIEEGRLDGAAGSAKLVSAFQNAIVAEGATSANDSGDEDKTEDDTKSKSQRCCKKTSCTVGMAGEHGEEEEEEGGGRGVSKEKPRTEHDQYGQSDGGVEIKEQDSERREDARAYGQSTASEHNSNNNRNSWQEEVSTEEERENGGNSGCDMSGESSLEFETPLSTLKSERESSLEFETPSSTFKPERGRGGGVIDFRKSIELWEKSAECGFVTKDGRRIDGNTKSLGKLTLGEAIRYTKRKMKEGGGGGGGRDRNGTGGGTPPLPVREKDGSGTTTKHGPPSRYRLPLTPAAPLIRAPAPPAVRSLVPSTTCDTNAPVEEGVAGKDEGSGEGVADGRGNLSETNAGDRTSDAQEDVVEDRANGADRVKNGCGIEKSEMEEEREDSDATDDDRTAIEDARGAAHRWSESSPAEQEAEQQRHKEGGEHNSVRGAHVVGGATSAVGQMTGAATGEAMFPCPDCGRRFNHASLNRHVLFCKSSGGRARIRPSFRVNGSSSSDHERSWGHDENLVARVGGSEATCKDSAGKHQQQQQQQEQQEQRPHQPQQQEQEHP
ncbi:hypothetical protein CBR_g41123 [Chara braunii]|uniref:Uncharacterized protein n=1 Tax=Chara braunii TaxID=69332 RepID=A0A388LV79_CHABU|nr:hypothetical protein CBR_g41123 [Chara braunii]|eukprot:GBG86218.1 hypothetical protein CBR_g41123 [Chara braunii]